MNTFFRQSNRVLLPFVFALGAGLALSQLNRAQAVVVTDCPNEFGTIGTGSQCINVTNYATPNDCLVGNDASGNQYCCQYATRVYLCWVTPNFAYTSGRKGFFQSAWGGVSCVQENDGSSNCHIGYE